MDIRIKQVATRLKILFAAFWILPVLLVVLGENGNDWVGLYADNVRVTYFSETLAILLAAICVPVSLKLFAWVLVRKIDTVTLPQALRLYVLWSTLLIVLLTLPVIAGLAVYYLTLSNTGLLCALMPLTASLFCMPGEERLRKELHIHKEEKE